MVESGEDMFNDSFNHDLIKQFLKLHILLL
jgi:hypothetical protein